MVYVIFCHIATVKDLVKHNYDYLIVNMDAEVVTRLMVTQQLLNEDIVKDAVSDNQTNYLISQQEQTLYSFSQMLKTNDSHKHIGAMLIKGK